MEKGDEAGMDPKGTAHVSDWMPGCPMRKPGATAVRPSDHLHPHLPGLWSQAPPLKTGSSCLQLH